MTKKDGEHIPGGCYLKARAIQQSEIAHKPPHFREIWDYLLMSANHKDSAVCGRGQCVRSYKDIQNDLAWYAGWRKNMYKKHDCENAMKYLVKAGMVASRKTTRGMVITICNYDRFQTISNYENHSENNTKARRKLQSTGTINKNVKNIRKKYISNDFDFEAVYKKYPSTQGKTVGMKKLLTKIKTQEQFDKFKVAVDNYVDLIESTGQYAKHWSTFVNCWEDYLEKQRTPEQEAFDAFDEILAEGFKELEQKNARDTNQQRGNETIERKEIYTPPPF